jgi:hypothetical protein
MEHSKLITSISFFDESPIVIGIDKRHCSETRLANNNILPITEEAAVYLLRLLKIEYRTFYQEIEKMIEKIDAIDRQIGITAANFPFDVIIKAALTSERDYWIELSMSWIKEIGKNKFADEIKGVIENKNVSQGIRHLLLKL